MKSIRPSILLHIILVTCLLTETKSQHILQSSSVNNGTEKANGTNYVMVPSVGQQVTGKGTSSGHILTIGFIPTAIPRQAELTVSSLSISPDVVGPASNTNLTLTLANTGAIDIETEISAEVYLSANSTFEPEDVLLDEFTIVTGLAAGATFDFPVGSNTQSVTIPQGTSSGDYQLFVVLTTADPVDEINPVNVFSVSVTVGNVTTGDTQSPIITAVSSRAFDASQDLSVTINDASDVNALLYYRRITDETFSSVELEHGDGQSYTITLQEAWADEIGMEGYIFAEDLAGNTSESDPFFLYRESDESTMIPFAGASFNGKANTYRMFSIPYQLEDRDLEVIFSELGGYDENVWRIFHYGNNGYVELNSGLTNVDRGNGYWFNTTSSDFEVTIGDGKTVPDGSSPFPYSKSFRQGWNQIGNPYPFEISWADIQAANPDRNLGAAHVFSNGSYQTTTTLAPWEGAFVFCETSGTVSFPLSSKSGARMVEEDPDQYEWQLEMEISLGELSQKSRIGMAARAQEGKDHLDEIAVPRFIDYLEMTTHHPEFFAPKFTRDFVPSTNHYEWSFDLASNLSAGQAELTWDPELLANVEGTCFLLDTETLQVIDMSQSSTFRFNWGNGKKLKVIYSADGLFTTSENQIGNVYPNPFHKVVKIPLIVADMNEPLDVKVFNISGQSIYQELKQADGLGKQNYIWNGLDHSGNEIADGLYLIRIDFSKESKTLRIIKSSQP